MEQTKPMPLKPAGGIGLNTGKINVVDQLNAQSFGQPCSVLDHFCPPFDTGNVVFPAPYKRAIKIKNQGWFQHGI